MISIRELQNLLTNKAFNPYLDLNNPDKVLIHLTEELGEVCKAYRKYGISSKEFDNELGDVQILLAFFASATNTDLQNVTLLKIMENITLGKFQPSQEKLKELEKIW